MDQPKATPKSLIQLAPGKDNLAPFEYASTRHNARIPAGVQPSALMDPGFWAHHATTMRPMDEIRAQAEDGTWVGYYLVLDTSRVWARVHELSLHRLTTKDVSITQASEGEIKAVKDAHKVVHRGPHKWSVVRASDKAVMEQGLAQREIAETWLDNYARTQVGGAAQPRQPAASVAA